MRSYRVHLVKSLLFIHFLLESGCSQSSSELGIGGTGSFAQCLKKTAKFISAATKLERKTQFGNVASKFGKWSGNTVGIVGGPLVGGVMGGYAGYGAAYNMGSLLFPKLISWPLGVMAGGWAIRPFAKLGYQYGPTIGETAGEFSFVSAVAGMRALCSGLNQYNPYAVVNAPSCLAIISAQVDWDAYSSNHSTPTFVEREEPSECDNTSSFQQVILPSDES